MNHARLIAVVAAAAALLSGSAGAQTAVEKAQRDEIFQISQGDPDMAAAMKKARASLPEFFAVAKSPKPSMKGFAVKVGVRAGNGHEFFWIVPFERKGDGYSGRLNNTPRTVKNLKAGDTITFAENEIVDWMYVDDGKMKGNYTACALLKHEPKQQAEAFMKQYRLDCSL